MIDALFAAAAEYCSCIQKGRRGGIRANSEGLERVKQLVLSNFTDSTAKKHCKHRCEGCPYLARYWRIGWYWPCLLQLASRQIRQHQLMEVVDVPQSVLCRLFGLEPWRSWSFLVIGYLYIRPEGLLKKLLHKVDKSYGFLWTARQLSKVFLSKGLYTSNLGFRVNNLH